jgi:hypothetical protein
MTNLSAHYRGIRFFVRGMGEEFTDVWLRQFEAGEIVFRVGPFQENEAETNPGCAGRGIADCSRDAYLNRPRPVREGQFPSKQGRAGFLTSAASGRITGPTGPAVGNQPQLPRCFAVVDDSLLLRDPSPPNPLGSP